MIQVGRLSITCKDGLHAPVLGVITRNQVVRLKLMFDYTRKRRVAVYKRKKVPFQRTQLVYRSGAATEAQTRNLAQNLQKYHNKQIPEP